MENKPKRLVKGSQEAKDHMATIRSKRGNKKPVEEPKETIIEPIEEPIEAAPKKRKPKKINVEFS